MLQVINPNSYLIAAGMLFSVLVFIVITFLRRRKIAWLGLGGLAAFLILGNLALRDGTSEIETAAQFDQIIASGKPVVLEIYSNY